MANQAIKSTPDTSTFYGKEYLSRHGVEVNDESIITPWSETFLKFLAGEISAEECMELQKPRLTELGYNPHNLL